MQFISRRGLTSGIMGSAALVADDAAAQPGVHLAQGQTQGPAQSPTPAPPAVLPGGGDLSRLPPIDLVVELGNAQGGHHFSPTSLRFRTGRLYKLILRNNSPHPHYFTSDGLAASIWTRKVQVMSNGPQPRVMAEVKGAIREVEVHPGFSAEWWFVPVATGRFTDLRCDIKAEDGRTHAEHGMRGEIIIE